MEKTAVGVREHTKTASPRFSTENGLQCDQMTDTVWQFLKLVFLANCSGGGGKPEASVVKETPNLREERVEEEA